MTSQQKLEQLTAAIEASRMDVAPTYQEYMTLAFAIANTVGEAGRGCFHRICSLSAKYEHAQAERLFSDAVTHGRGGNSLGSVFHLASAAGVKFTSEQQREYNLVQRGAAATDASSLHAIMHHAPLSSPTHACVPYICNFEDYARPSFLQQMIDCGDSPAQRDVILLGALTVLGATIGPRMHFIYGRKRFHPNLQTLVTAPPASGKYAIVWTRRLAEPIHEGLMDNYHSKCESYKNDKRQWDLMGKDRFNIPEPEEPQLVQFLITADNSGTGLSENIINAKGVGLICESEADTVSQAIGTDYGHWSDSLRKFFDHERLAYNRRTNHEYRECRRTFVSVLLSGTPAQVRPLIPSAENGLFSRQVFYTMPAITEWKNQFDETSVDYGELFYRWGERWKLLIDHMRTDINQLQFVLSTEQQNQFNDLLSRLFTLGGMAHGSHMRSAVARIAINLLRIMSIIALLRAVDEPLMATGHEEEHQPFTFRFQNLPGFTVAAGTNPDNIKDGIASRFTLSINDTDFSAVLSMADVLYRHACHMLTYLPGTDLKPQEQQAHVQLLDRMPVMFTRQMAMEEAKKLSISENNLNSWLYRWTERGEIIKTGRGEYLVASHPEKSTLEHEEIN